MRTSRVEEFQRLRCRLTTLQDRVQSSFVGGFDSVDSVGFSLDDVYDNRATGLDSRSQNRENPPLRFINLLSRVLELVLCPRCPGFFAIGDEVFNKYRDA